MRKTFQFLPIALLCFATVLPSAVSRAFLQERMLQAEDARPTTG
jgi:hypothetical protein